MKTKKSSFTKLIRMYFHKYNKDDINGLSAEMGFFLLTALFPFIILVFIIATLISSDMQEILMSLITYLPRDLEGIVIELLANFGGSMPIIIISGSLGLWYITNVINTLTKAMNRFYSVKETRGFVKTRIIYLLFALLIFVLIFMSFAFIIFGQGTHLLLKRYDFLSFFDTKVTWNLLRYFAVVFVIFITMLLMFRILPNKKLSFKAVAYGAALTTAAWCITSYGFSFYVSNFSRYHVIYGSLASIIILVTWVYMSALVILAGASINAYWYRIRLAKKIVNSSKH